ncbi:hypothetical protein FC17_GL000360 [Secundilactobacillus paracollinoides DSM 15502 = JCM 11969]|nr:hypothetical protein FC17_GL000360 [Secundilactobacillus paracollinoides DSM 15502 = JCM 11969]
MEQFGTELWCRHQLATVLWSVTDVRDDGDPFESCAAEIELASSRATTRSAKLRNATDLPVKPKKRPPNWKVVFHLRQINLVHNTNLDVLTAKLHCLGVGHGNVQLVGIAVSKGPGIVDDTLFSVAVLVLDLKLSALREAAASALVSLLIFNVCLGRITALTDERSFALTILWGVVSYL